MEQKVLDNLREARERKESELENRRLIFNKKQEQENDRERRAWKDPVARRVRNWVTGRSRCL